MTDREQEELEPNASIDQFLTAGIRKTFQEAMDEVLQNLASRDHPWKKERTITMVFGFKPQSDDGRILGTTIKLKVGLPAREAQTQFGLLGTNLKTGEPNLKTLEEVNEPTRQTAIVVDEKQELEEIPEKPHIQAVEG